MKRFIFWLALLCLPVDVSQAQSVQQSGSVTAGHAAMWATNGVIKDAGTAANGLLTSLGVTNNGGPGICVNSGPITGPYNQTCISSATNGGSTFSSYAYGGATSPGFKFNVNGSLQGFPLVTLPVSNNDFACFDGTTGTLKDCGGNSGGATVTNHAVVIGTGNSFTFNGVGPGTSGLPLVGGGASADPSFAVLTVPGGGTGQTTFAAHAVILGNSTSALAHASPSTLGYALIDNGASSDPSFQANYGTFVGTITGGSANTQTLASPIPSWFTLTAGYTVCAKAGFTNTGATTLAVNGTTATAINSRSTAGLSAFVGGELVGGQSYCFQYDGMVYEKLNSTPGAVEEKSTNYIATAKDGNGDTYIFTASASLTIPLSTTIPNNWRIFVFAEGGNVTVTPNASDSINGQSVGTILTLAQGASSTITTDGAGNIFVPNPGVTWPGPGVVRMYRLPQSYTWIVKGANGVAVNIAGSTSQGLQEAINQAAADGVCLIVEGGGQKTVSGTQTDWATIVSTATITLPPSTKACYHLNGVSVEFTAGTSADGFLVDSFDVLRFDFSGQIIYTGTGSAFHLLPLNPNQENFTGAISSNIHIGTIVCTTSLFAPDPTKGKGLTLTPAGAPIQLNNFLVNEINGCAQGIFIDKPVATDGSVERNQFTSNVHNQGTISVEVGNGANTRIKGNIWNLTLNPTGTSAIGIDTYAQGDITSLSFVAGGATQTGIQLNTGANNNTFWVATNTATTPYSDGSGTSTNTQVIQGIGLPAAGELLYYTAAGGPVSGSANFTIAGSTLTTPIAKLSGASNQLVFQSGGVTGTMSWAPASTNKTLTWPNGTTDFTATGGTSQVVKQVSSGAAFTVGQLACGDLSNAGTACSATIGNYLPLAGGTMTGALTNTNAAPQIILGVNTTTLGAIKMFGNTSGDVTVEPAAVAGTSTVITLPAATGTLATLAGTEELTNKTLNASIGKGTWTASGTWTLPAFTLNGTVSGGGNQINNVIIGTSTPLAGSFTTLTASTSLTTPLHIGGSGTTGTQLTLQTTTGNGTTDQFAFNGGNNGNENFANLLANALILPASVTNTDTIIGLYADSSSGAQRGQATFYSKNRGGVVVNGQYIGSFSFFGYDGGAYQGAAGLNAVVDGIGAPGGNPTTNNVPISLRFQTGHTSSPTDRMVVWSDGGVSIGNYSDNGAGTLVVNGSISAGLAQTTELNMVCYNSTSGLMTYSTIAQQCTVSSARYKEGIEKLGTRHLLDVVATMEPVSYTYKREMDLGLDRHVGLLAEQVSKIEQELVIYDKEGLPNAIKQAELPFYLIGAVKQLKADNDNLRAEINEIRRAVAR